SAIRNHGARVTASLTMMVDPTGRIMVDSPQLPAAGQDFPFPKLLADAERDGIASRLAYVGGQLVQLVVVPVRAPLTVASAVMGFRIDDAFARDVAALTSTDLSLVVATTAGPVIVASTLAPPMRDALAQAMSSATTRNGTLTLNDMPYATLPTELKLAGGGELVALLQQSLRDALMPFRQLQATLLALTLAALIAAIVLSVVTARGVTRPIKNFADFALRVGRGEYQHAAPNAGASELRALGLAFDRMRGDLAKREERITDLAYRDGLTRLPNRARFNEYLRVALARIPARSLAVLAIDLDHFRYVNDTLGHAFGDRLLTAVGARLYGALTDEHTIVARLGGDEFAVLIDNADHERASSAAARILVALEEHFEVDGQSIDVRASIGIVVAPEHGVEAQVLMSRADMAMYVAKRDRLGRAVYESSFDHGSQERLTLLSELRRAIDEDQTKVYYQPKLDIATGQVYMLEALVRWVHPRHGLIAPDRFIPFAEQMGIIRSITHWVINDVVRQIAAWRAQGLNVSVAVNISARDLLDADLPTFVNTRLRTNAVPPQALRLEITESAAMDDPRRALATLHALRELGVGLSIDDFGTGYSSLSYLHKMPVDELKIDKSFVSHLTEHQHEDDRVIVRATIDLGHRMGLKVVAEGVEDEATLALLREYGCDFAQGYLLSCPLAVDAITTWLLERQNNSHSPASALHSTPHSTIVTADIRGA
ncbi:MAG TPA: EAL domain-containing protein, partial [Burkholderiaceae bacterium]|nr:EAL domain-containing protein [Burkholderiaceae bacterium]